MKELSALLCVILLTGMQIPAQSHNDNSEMLDTIDFYTRTNQLIDISLPRNNHKEECSVRTPNGTVIELSDMNVKGVKVRKRSYFVSCGITVGPMVEDLVGHWSVCGRYRENNKIHERCQPANVYWNKNSPERDWIQTYHQHSVHYGSTMNHLEVRSSGEIVACHIVTNTGEDLAINQNSKYASINATTPDSACRFAIGPIHIGLTGNWTIYGLFNDSIFGLHEVRLPFNISIKDEENFNQIYNLTVLDPVTRAVNLGDVITLQVLGTSLALVDNCSFETPAGDIYSMEHDNNYREASFVNVFGEDACKLVIGPITGNMLGDWNVAGKFYISGSFIKRQQTYHLIVKDPTITEVKESPAENGIIKPLSKFSANKDLFDQASYLTILNPVTREVNLGNVNTVQVSGPSAAVVYSCSFTPPAGGVYTRSMGHQSYTGATFVDHWEHKCELIIGPITENQLGEWTVTGKFNLNGIFIERRKTFHLVKPSRTEVSDPKTTVEEKSIQEDRKIYELAPQNAEIEMGHSHRFVIPSQKDVYGESCHIVAPDGLQYQLGQTFNAVTGCEVIDEYGVECGVNITALTHDVVGRWMLIARSVRTITLIERRLRFHIYITKHQRQNHVTTQRKPLHDDLSFVTVRRVRPGSLEKNNISWRFFKILSLAQIFYNCELLAILILLLAIAFVVVKL